jgi:cytochrome bd-type quinol oxidase subunit 1
MELTVVIGALLVIVDVWVVSRIARSKSGEIGKVAWVVAILLLPVIAHVGWYLAGPGRPA